MKSFLALTTCAVASLCVVAAVNPSHAQSTDEVLRRLEAKIDALAKENSSLRSRLSRVEASRSAAKPKQEKGYVGPIGKASADPTPQQIAAAQAAYAADMSVAARYTPPMRPACAQFGGWNIGINGGWASLDSRWVDRDAWVDNFSTDWALGTVSNQHGGATVGGQLGYLWQAGCTVYGFEVDADWADLDRTGVYDSSGGTGTALTLKNDLQWYGSLRGRTGLIVDNLLLYVTGGLAYAKIDNTWTITDPNNPTQTFAAKDNRWGGVLGVGAEWAFNANWSARTEFLYYIFKEVQTSGVTVSNGQPVSFDSQDSMWVTRFALNYRFN